MFSRAYRALARVINLAAPLATVVLALLAYAQLREAHTAAQHAEANTSAQVEVQLDKAGGFHVTNRGQAAADYVFAACILMTDADWHGMPAIPKDAIVPPLESTAPPHPGEPPPVFAITPPPTATPIYAVVQLRRLASNGGNMEVGGCHSRGTSGRYDPHVPLSQVRAVYFFVRYFTPFGEERADDFYFAVQKFGREYGLVPLDSHFPHLQYYAFFKSALDELPNPEDQ